MKGFAMGKCAWCGNYIADSGDRGMGKEFMNQMGLGLVTKIGGAVIPRYCSKACKEAAKASKNKGAPTESGDGEPAAVKAPGMFDFQGQAQVQLQALANEKKELSEKVANVHFGDTSSEIENTLNDLFATYKQMSGGYADISLMVARKTAKAAILEKADFGIMKLRKLDADSADFFQKKLDEIKNPHKKGLFGKK
jgi:hypothetical protein